MTKPPPPLADIEAFLADHHVGAVDALEPLAGGYWSSAYGYRVDGREYVLRFGADRHGYDADRAAMRHRGPDLPIPIVESIGTALGFSYAISERHHGRFLEEITPADADAAGPAIVGLLDALRRRTSPDTPDWHGWLRRGLADEPGHHTAGWRPKLAERTHFDRLFRACEAKIESLLDACPPRNALVHSDLLHQNVLVSEDATEVTAVFSWKCSTFGDFVYDTAWCTFWNPWHPGMGAVDVYARMAEHLADDPGAGDDLAVRHHCYELQIGAQHFGWYVHIDDDVNLGQCAERLAEVLERGPRT